MIAFLGKKHGFRVKRLNNLAESEDGWYKQQNAHIIESYAKINQKSILEGVNHVRNFNLPT